MTHRSQPTTVRPTTHTDTRDRRTPATLPARTPVTTSPPTDDLSGIGDIALAGQSSGYTHLRPRGVPTVGRLATAAREAATVLARPTLWPRRRRRWQLAPRPARRRAGGRMRVTVVALEPNDFVALPQLGSHGRPAPGTDVLHLARGHAHTVVSTPDGEMRAVQELGAGRVRVLGEAGHHRLINTGTSTAVVVRVTGP